MSYFRTKSKNIDLYKHFFQYDDPEEIPFIELANKLGVIPNKLRGMMRAAKHSYTIYIDYRRKGYPDSAIPSWFLRPPKSVVDFIELETAPTQRSPIQRRLNTGTTAEVLSAEPSKRRDIPPIGACFTRDLDVPSAPLRTAERFQRTRDDGPAYINLFDRKKYPIPSNYFNQRELNPAIERELKMMQTRLLEEDEKRLERNTTPFKTFMETISTPKGLKTYNDMDARTRTRLLNLIETAEYHFNPIYRKYVDTMYYQWYMFMNT